MEKKVKKQLLALILAASAIPVASACSCDYALDATGAQYSGFGLLSFPTISGGSAQFTVSNTGGAVPNYVANSRNGLNAGYYSSSNGWIPSGDITLPASGIVGVEMKVDSFPTVVDTTSGGGNVMLNLGLSTSNPLSVSPATTDTFGANVYIYDTPWSGGPFSDVVGFARPGSTGVVASSASYKQPLTLPLPAGFRLGLYINMNTRHVGFTVNGSDKGYIQDSSGNPLTIPSGITSLTLGVTGLQQTYTGSLLIGSVVKGTLVTSKSLFTQPFPAGTKDICGN